ncbi:hypothetical protein HNY73_017823 [Argiope bruennichi]|uniref:Uncharacterized protein n=1 Tax=Argiope bruennichi TaxID=94029 RepID=A0A8T0EC42_ARGBR|nr:hypothetical protein HNY73_017823 [Argiope bruennichi]
MTEEKAPKEQKDLPAKEKKPVLTLEMKRGLLKRSKALTMDMGDRVSHFRGGLMSLPEYESTSLKSELSEEETDEAKPFPSLPDRLLINIGLFGPYNEKKSMCKSPKAHENSHSYSFQFLCRSSYLVFLSFKVILSLENSPWVTGLGNTVGAIAQQLHIKLEIALQDWWMCIIEQKKPKTKFDVYFVCGRTRIWHVYSRLRNLQLLTFTCLKKFFGDYALTIKKGYERTNVADLIF